MAAAQAAAMSRSSRRSRSSASTRCQAMQSGVFWGYVGLIEGWSTRIKRRVWRADEGDRDRRPGAAVRGRRRVLEHVDRDLTLDGLLGCLPRQRNEVANQPRDELDQRQRPRLPAARRRRRDRHEPQSLRPCRQMADDRSRRHASATTPRPASRSSCRIRPSSTSAATACVGLVLTHAHEDHLGAVPYLWPRLRCPDLCDAVHAPSLRRKLATRALSDEVPITEVPPSAASQHRPFDLELITLTHSIPEPNAIVIRTPRRHGAAHRRLEARSRSADRRGHRRGGAAPRWATRASLAMVCDSTNVFEDGRSGSEARARWRR